MTQGHQPLDGLLVVDLSQFLAGPYASLRLQDMGARVIKIERPDGGDLTRNLYFSDTVIDGESTVFHAINRGKESLALDLKDPTDCARLKTLIGQADVVLQNFRPGVIERLGFDYATLSAQNPGLVYGSVSGYGPDSPWRDKPGQDLLAQARSGVMWLNGSADDGPVPFGLAVADMMAGAALAQGVLAALVGQGRTGRGAHVETSLLEAMLDLQFEVLATHMNDGGRPPQRSSFRSAHPALPAPYGVYPTQDGFLAVAMMPIRQLAEVLDLDALLPFADDTRSWFRKRDEIKSILAAHLAQAPTAHWLSLLEPHGIWVAQVHDWPELLSNPAFTHLDMVQKVRDAMGAEMRLIRAPIRINGERGRSTRAAPEIGRDNAKLIAEFGL